MLFMCFDGAFERINSFSKEILIYIPFVAPTVLTVADMRKIKQLIYLKQGHHSCWFIGHL